MRLPARLLAVLIACGCLLAASSVVGAAPATARLVALGPGASLEEALEAVQRATGGVVLAEQPGIERKLKPDAGPQPLAEALQEVSGSFDLYWVRRGRTVAFQRRYSDPRELPDLELEALTQIVSDTKRLLESFYPFPDRYSNVEDQRDFYRSLTTEQLNAMQGGGVPLAALRPEQRKLWEKINTIGAYIDVLGAYRKLEHCFATWRRGTLKHYVDHPLFDGKRILDYYYTPPGETESIPYMLLQDGHPVRSAGPTAGAGENRDARAAGLPSSFNRPVGLESGTSTLAGVVAALNTATGNEIQIPSYARSRALLAYTPDVPARDLVRGLEDLYGWKLQWASGRRYLLGPPRPAAAANPVELHHSLRAVLPPSIRHTWGAVGASLKAILKDENGDSRDGRYTVARQQVLDSITRVKGNGWKEATVAELDAPTQRTLANLLFTRGARPSAFYLIAGEEPPKWLASPDRALLSLQGEIGPGKHPTLWFKVPGETHLPGWGFIVGSNSRGE